MGKHISAEAELVLAFCPSSSQTILYGLLLTIEWPQSQHSMASQMLNIHPAIVIKCKPNRGMGARESLRVETSRPVELGTEVEFACHSGVIAVIGLQEGGARQGVEMALLIRRPALRRE